MSARAPIADRPGHERWRLARDAGRVAARLLALGEDGVGGFVEAGEDAEGWWLVRAPGAPTLASWLRERRGPVPWLEAIALVASLADAAAACERASLFPGPLDPDAIVVRDGRLDVRADSLVAALAGDGRGASPATVSGSARWLSPAQADGAPADSASNRYAIGLVLYRLLAAEHPFAGGVGLRHGLDDQVARGAPPLPSAVAAQLPAGLQSFTLRLLDPDAARRPGSSASIARDLRAFLAPAKLSKLTPSPAPARDAGDVKPREIPTFSGDGVNFDNFRRWPRYAAFFGPLALACLAAAALANTGVGRAGTTTTTRARAKDAPLAKATELADCASCHPRQGNEWSRSVMAHATGSPLYQSLEMLIEEQVGRDRDCPGGAGVLRAAGPGACVNPRTGIAETGAGGALWCVNCHAPGENLQASLPPWSAFDERSRRPLRDLLPASAMQGIGCAFCHQVTGPARPGAAYEGNPSWISPETGQRFTMRPEDERGRFGIANSGYALDPRALLGGDGPQVAGGAHRATPAAARAYLGSSALCGACHDVRLFGTDALEGVRRGEHFKRLRNAYSEWVEWSERERRLGRAPASCQDCHMSLYPGVCVPGDADADLAGRTCPPGTRFAPLPPGTYAQGPAAAGGAPRRVHGHAFTGVDLPLDPAFDARALDDATLDVDGAPVGAKQRRDLLLARTFRLSIDGARRGGDRLELPITVENVGAGHRVPAGFSQEREIWLHVRVTDARGAVRYEAGRVDRATDDLRDKVMLQVNTRAAAFDRRGRPLGLFGADVADGPDVPQWTSEGAGSFRGRGLVNFQNGFLRCVRCIGEIDARGRCQPLPGQERARADRYADGDYDLDTGACRSNLRGEHAFVEIFFPVGALDATRGVVRGPDAIVDTRSLAPGVPQRYVHELEIPDAAGPLRIEVTLRFRAFPPYLIRAFIDYEREQARLGRRPSGPLVDARALERLDIVDVAAATVDVP